MRVVNISGATAVLDHPYNLERRTRSILAGAAFVPRKQASKFRRVRQVDCHVDFVAGSAECSSLTAIHTRISRNRAAHTVGGTRRLLPDLVGGNSGCARQVAKHATQQGWEASGGTGDSPTDFIREQLATIETNLDDLNPQVLAYAIERLFQNGALDVWVVPALMKKGRPASILNVLCRKDEVDKLLRVIFQETTSLGARVTTCERVSLPRAWKSVETEWGRVRVKQGYMGGSLINSHPEYEDCALIARTHGVPIQVVMDKSMHMYQMQEETVNTCIDCAQACPDERRSE